MHGLGYHAARRTHLPLDSGVYLARPGYVFESLGCDWGSLITYAAWPKIGKPVEKRTKSGGIKCQPMYLKTNMLKIALQSQWKANSITSSFCESHRRYSRPSVLSCALVWHARVPQHGCISAFRWDGPFESFWSFQDREEKVWRFEYMFIYINSYAILGNNNCLCLDKVSSKCTVCQKNGVFKLTI